MKHIIIKHKAYTWTVYGSLVLYALPLLIDIIFRLFAGQHPWQGKIIDFNYIWFITILLAEWIFAHFYWGGLVNEIRINNNKINLSYLINKSYYAYVTDVKMTENDEKIYFSDDKKLNVYLFKKDLREEDYVTLKEMVQKS